MDFSNFRENEELEILQKRREVNNFKGFSNTDNLSLINNSTLFRVNNKIDQLQEQIKALVVKYKEELKKIIKRCKKHKQMIEDELNDEQMKQNNMYEETIQKNNAEINRLKSQLNSEANKQKEEVDSFIESKEKLLNYVIIGKFSY